MPATNPAPARRPRRKQSAIIAAASTLFQEYGFAATSMDAVARLADVSKATLYSYYAGKNDLFADVVGLAAGDYAALVTEGAREGETLAESLMRFGRGILGLLLAPETVASLRMVVAEAARLPELGRIYFENGPLRLRAALEGFFEQAIARGLMKPVEPGLAAAQFVGLIQGDLRLRAILAQAESDERETLLAAGVQVFCAAYGGEGGST